MSGVRASIWYWKRIWVLVRWEVRMVSVAATWKQGKPVQLWTNITQILLKIGFFKNGMTRFHIFRYRQHPSHHNGHFRSNRKPITKIWLEIESNYQYSKKNILFFKEPCLNLNTFTILYVSQTNKLSNVIYLKK